MRTSLVTQTDESANPLDLVEEIVSANGWPYERADSDELVVEVRGRWSDYSMVFAWESDLNALRFWCAPDVRVPAPRRAAVSELLSIVNERMLLGHFGLAREEGTLAFRHTALLRGAPGATVEQLEDMVDIALGECERFYPAFQYVIWAGKGAEEAVAMALIDPVGEA